MSEAKRKGVRRVATRWLRGLAVVTACVTAATFFARWSLWCDVVVSFQPQLLVVSLLILGGLLAVRSWRWSAIAGVCMLLAVVRVAPIYRPAPASDQPTSGPVLRVMLFNVLQDNARYDDVIAEVLRHDPDLLVLQECDEIWYERVATLSKSLPQHLHVPGTTNRGMAIFSRAPLLDLRVLDLNNIESRTIGAEIQVGTRRITILASHPWPPAWDLPWRSRNRQLELTADELNSRPGPKLLVGDLNITMWSPFYGDFIRRTGLLNVRQGFGVLPTFPRDELPLLRVPIDHMLVSEDVQVRTCVVGEPCGSDHAPLIVELSLTDGPS